MRSVQLALAAVAVAACGRIGVNLQAAPDAALGSRDAGARSGVDASVRSGVDASVRSGVDASVPDAGVANHFPSMPDASQAVMDAGVPGAAGGGGNVAAAGSGGRATRTDAGPTAGAGGAGGSSAGAGGSPPDAGTSPVCGNSKLELGEECDDGAASARCDADCTFASCGDGVANALAGETCDNGDRLASCSPMCRVPQCRTGCTCEFYRGVRYMYCAEQLAWQPAAQACQQLGMHLLRIGSGTEQTFLRQRSQQFSFSKYQLGATDLAAEGTWVWDDGTVFWNGLANGMAVAGQFSAWADGEPNAFVVEENCSEVQSIQGWNDCGCDPTKPFMCKDTRDRRSACGNGVVDQGEACDGAGETSACDADCSPAVCGDGVRNATAGEQCDDAATGQFCSANCGSFLCPAGCSCVTAAGTRFAVCNQATSFRDAGVKCGLAGMTLARVVSSTVNQALRTAANTASIGEFWIGVFDIDRPDHWLRSDLSLAWDGTVSGTAHGYTNFISTAPSGTSNRDCAAVLADGHWQDADCSVQKAYACERF